MKASVAIEVLDASGPAAARRAVQAVCSRLGFDQADAGRASIVVTEIATNLFKHAGSGEVVITALDAGAGVTLQVLGLDKGPGFDPAVCLRDGYSTAGSPGNGLGAMRRLSNAFGIYTRRGQGSAVLVEIVHAGPPKGPASAPGPWVGGIAVPAPGEVACGDAWSVRACDGKISAFLADGLGHGLAAAEAAHGAVEAFARSAGQPPTAVMGTVHGAIRSTRGAAVAVAQIDERAGRVLFAGVGNISAAIAHGGQLRHLVSHNGTVGHEMRRVQEFAYDWPSGARLVLASDGLSARWDLAAYPGVLDRHPALLAGVLYRDFSRRRDDASVLVAAESPPAPEGS